jgi:hypothetical protein
MQPLEITHILRHAISKGDRIGNHSHPATHIAILASSYMNTQLHEDESRDEQEERRGHLPRAAGLSHENLESVAGSN